MLRAVSERTLHGMRLGDSVRRRQHSGQHTVYKVYVPWSFRRSLCQDDEEAHSITTAIDAAARDGSSDGWWLGAFR